MEGIYYRVKSDHEKVYQMYKLLIVIPKK